MTLPSSLRARVLGATRGKPALTRSASRARNSVVVLAAAGASLAVFFAMGGVRPTDRPSHLMVETALGALCIAVLAAFVAFGRGGSMLGRAAPVLAWSAVLVPFALLAWKVGISANHAGMMREWPERVGFRCLRLSLLLTAVPLVAVIAVWRRTDPTHPHLTGAALGTALGAASWVLVDLWCPVAHVPHLLLGHVLPLVLATVAGAVVGGRFIALHAK